MQDQNDLSGCIDKWRKQLLDLTGRNRMLFYRPSRASLRVHRDEARIWTDLLEEGEVELDEEALVPPSTPQSVAARQLEDADRRIKRLVDISRTFLDEQGVHVLYAVFGWLNWVDETRPPGPGDETVKLRSGREARKVRSPLLFVPVTLQRTSKATRVKFEENASIETNLTLEVFLEQQSDIRVSFDPESDLTPEVVVAVWRAAIRNREHWSVEHGSDGLLDSFSFKKIALLRQLERSAARIFDQPVLRALCGDAGPLLEAPAVPSFDNLDEAISSEDLDLVVPADASQLKALLAVNKGVNLVVQGPPGTGKSQTITNIVSTMVARGKRVLFIAEKRPARDIVVENLTKAGLGEVVLHITEEVLGQRGSSQAKRDIVDQLADILEQGAGEYVVEGDYKADYERVRADLNRYVARLHSPLGPSPWSTPYMLIAAWAGARQGLAKDVGVPLPSIKQVAEAWKDRAFEVASRIDDLGEDVLGSAKGPWLEAQPKTWNAESHSRISAALEVLARGPGVVSQLLQVHQTLEEPEGWTLPRLQYLATHLVAVGAHNAARDSVLGLLMPKYWRTRKAHKEFRSAGWTDEGRAQHTAAVLESELQKIREAKAKIEDMFPRRPRTDSLNELAAFGKELLTSIHSAQNAVQVRTRCMDAHDMHLGDALLEIVRQKAPNESIRDLLEATLSRWWATEASQSDPALGLEGPALNRQVDRLRTHETRALLKARAGVLNAVAPYRSSNIEVAPRDSELGTLRSQINAKKRKPLRWLFTRAANLILQMKPCVVASPLAVAQFLHSDAYEFDIVVFDEASQIPTADAVVPISRAKQVVIVGDSQQMPPTSFFDRAVSLDTDDTDEVVYESILQDSETLLPSLPLTWHYRSLDERLIAFSNQSFYGGKLLTFPSAWLDHPDLGIKFVYLPSAVYGRGGSRANPDEANQVIEILKGELKSHPEHEIGVTAMSIAQAGEIQARLEQAAESSPEIRDWLEQGGRARHLETVQGDEFDVSLLSFGYGRDASGNLQLNFGPLSRDDGYKRLNVAVTRARKKMIVVSSVRGADIPVGRVSEGGQRVRQFLEYAEHGATALAATVGLATGGVDTFESPLEQDVAREIRALGWSVDTQVGVNRFRVDIGVKHPKFPGWYLAGIECDGATYHNGATARDRDIGRQQVLQKLGWRLFRVWSPDWFRGKQRVLGELHKFLSQLLEDDSSGGSEKPPSRPEPPGSGAGATSGPAFRRSEPGLRPGTLPYRLEGPRTPPTRQDDVSAWAGWLTEKIKKEGPWDKREIMTVASSHLGYRNSLLDYAARQAVTEGELEVRGSTYWATDIDPRLVPVKVSNGVLRRDFDCYSDEELLRAFELACAEVGGISGEELVRFTSRFLGFARISSEIRARLEALIARALEEGYIRKDGETYRAGDHWRQYTPVSVVAPYTLPTNQPSPALPPRTLLVKRPTSPQRPRLRGSVGVGPSTPSITRLPLRSLIALAHDETKSLKIRYRSGAGQVTSRVVDVLGVGANYFDAFDHLRNEQRTFKIDRVINAELTSASFRPTQAYRPSEWVGRRR